MTDIHTHQEYNKVLILMSREQLMEDIEGIVESFFYDTWGDYDEAECNQLIETICDAVCKNFPTH